MMPLIFFVPLIAVAAVAIWAFGALLADAFDNTPWLAWIPLGICFVVVPIVLEATH